MNKKIFKFLTFNNFAIFLIFVISITLLKPLFNSGIYPMHDDQQVARLFLFDEALRSGQFPVRWVSTLGFGFGYPFFNFYPPLVYAIGETFHLIGFSFIASIKLVFFASIFLSGVTIYIFAKELFGKISAVTAAVFYMALPYRAIDVFIRGALAESFSFVWLPLILWGFYKLFKESKPLYVVSSGLFLGLLMITHNLIFLPFTLILPLFLIFLIYRSSSKLRFLVYSFMSLVIALGISAFFWLPSLMEKKFTLVDDLLLADLANFRIHFVYPNQLWNWPWGFGGSAQGLSDGISFKIGKLHILISIAAFLLTAIRLVHNNIKNQTNIQLLARRSFSEVGSLVFLLLLTFSAFMTTNYSKSIWELFTPLAYLQFPWRFLTFTGLFSSILAGAFIFSLRFQVLKILFATIVVVLVLFFNLKLFKPQAYRSNITDKDMTNFQTIAWDVSNTSFEYAPQGFPLTRGEKEVNIADIKKNELTENRVKVLYGDVSIKENKTKPHKLLLKTESKAPSNVIMNNFYFPGWQAIIDGHKLTLNNDNRYKLISFILPEGVHDVEVIFKNTKVRTFANLISLTTLSIIIFSFFKWRILKNR